MYELLHTDRRGFDRDLMVAGPDLTSSHGGLGLPASVACRMAASVRSKESGCGRGQRRRTAQDGPTCSSIGQINGFWLKLNRGATN
jgi:hypothetical protein